MRQNKPYRKYSEVQRIITPDSDLSFKNSLKYTNPNNQNTQKFDNYLSVDSNVWHHRRCSVNDSSIERSIRTSDSASNSSSISSFHSEIIQNNEFNNNNNNSNNLITKPYDRKSHKFKSKTGGYNANLSPEKYITATFGSRFDNKKDEINRSIRNDTSSLTATHSFKSNTHRTRRNTETISSHDLYNLKLNSNLTSNNPDSTVNRNETQFLSQSYNTSGRSSEDLSAIPISLNINKSKSQNDNSANKLLHHLTADFNSLYSVGPRRSDTNLIDSNLDNNSGNIIKSKSIMNLSTDPQRSLNQATCLQVPDTEELEEDSTKIIRHKSCDSSADYAMLEADMNQLWNQNINQRKLSHDIKMDLDRRNEKNILSQAIMSLKRKQEVLFKKFPKPNQKEDPPIDPVYHLLKCVSYNEHDPAVCDCPCHSKPESEVIRHAKSYVNLPAINYKSKKK